MKWEDERWVKLYTRDSVTWRRWGWKGQCVFLHLLRKVDHFGRIVLDDGLEPWEAVSFASDGMPEDICRDGIAALVRTKTLRIEGGVMELVNYTDAQEARTSAAERKRRQRERERAMAELAEREGGAVLEIAQGVTKRDGQSRSVTDSHAESRGVTRSHDKIDRETERETDRPAALTPDGAWTALRSRMLEMGHPTRPGATVTLPAGAPRDWPTIFRDWGGLRGVLDRIEIWHGQLKAGKGDPSWWSGKVFTCKSFAIMVADCDSNAASAAKPLIRRRLEHGQAY